MTDIISIIGLMVMKQKQINENAIHVIIDWKPAAFTAFRTKFSGHLGVPHGLCLITPKTNLCGRCDEKNELYQEGVLWDTAVQLYKCRSVGYCSAAVQVSFCGILQCSCTRVVRSIVIMIWYDIYLTAIGLTPGGSITRHIYKQTVHEIHTE